jgi:hypothetical protein
MTDAVKSVIKRDGKLQPEDVFVNSACAGF